MPCCTLCTCVYLWLLWQSIHIILWQSLKQCLCKSVLFCSKSPGDTVISNLYLSVHSYTEYCARIGLFIFVWMQSLHCELWTHIISSFSCQDDKLCISIRLMRSQSVMNSKHHYLAILEPEVLQLNWREELVLNPNKRFEFTLFKFRTGCYSAESSSEHSAVATFKVKG